MFLPILFLQVWLSVFHMHLFSLNFLCSPCIVAQPFCIFPVLMRSSWDCCPFARGHSFFGRFVQTPKPICSINQRLSFTFPSKLAQENANGIVTAHFTEQTCFCFLITVSLFVEYKSLVPLALFPEPPLVDWLCPINEWCFDFYFGFKTISMSLSVPTALSLLCFLLKDLIFSGRFLLAEQYSARAEKS